MKTILGESAKTKSSLIYFLYKGKDGDWRWYLKADNGNKVADSGEGYANRADAVHGIDLVKGSTDSPIVDLTVL